MSVLKPPPEALAQTPLSQALDQQSRVYVQCLPSSQRLHSPPQSTSVSVPFRMPSEQLAPPKATWTTAPLDVAETRRIESARNGVLEGLPHAQAGVVHVPVRGHVDQLGGGRFFPV